MSALDAIADWPVTSAAAAVVGPSGVLAEYGDQQREFALASVTKPLVARAVHIAVEEGVIELDTPAGPPGSTIRHLLAHASGLSMHTAEVLAEPGKRRMYSNYGFQVLAETVQNEAGIEFGRYLRDAVFEPLAMVGSRLHDGAVAAGYGATSTVADLARFGVQRPNDWGLGFEIRGTKSPHWTGSDNSARTYGHFGQSGTFIWADPERDLALVVLTDRDFGDWSRSRWPAFSDTVIAECGAD
jgi:CubicO group peptidase (beta-lactamase class C family)